MTTITAPTERIRTLGDLLDRLGGVPPDRVRMTPPPGQATEKDVIDAEAREHRLCELVDQSQTLEGGDVLSGFRLPVKDLFAELDRIESH